MNDKLTELSSFYKEKNLFVGEVIILLLAFFVLLSFSDRTGIGLFLIGIIILSIYFIFIYFKARKYVAIYKSSDNKFYIRKIFPLNKKNFFLVESIHIKRIFFSVYKVKITINQNEKTYLTYSYRGK